MSIANSLKRLPQGVLNIGLCLAIIISMAAFRFGQNVNAACSPQTDRGVVTYPKATDPSLSIDAGTYRVWSRIMVPDATNDSYLLEIDGGTCYVVGNSNNAATIPPNTWTWVDWSNSNTAANKINATFNTTTTHTIKMYGNEDNVKLDKVMFVTTAGCPTGPTGTGANCETPPVGDTQDPIVSVSPITSPVSGNITLTATATDDSGTVTKVEFYVDGVLKTPADTTSPYSYSLNTTTLTNGSHAITAKAYDPSNRVGTSTAVNFTVSNTQTAVPGDVDGDQHVNINDAIIVSQNWLRTGMSKAQGDLSGDGMVGLDDAILVSQNWGI